MVGYPGEAPEDVQASLDLLGRVKPTDLSVSIAYPLPGTEFFQRVSHRIKDRDDWEHTNQYPYAYHREKPDKYYRSARNLLLTRWHSLQSNSSLALRHFKSAEEDFHNIVLDLVQP